MITYAQAMRIAIKYSMDDVQDAIANVIQSVTPAKAITRLAFASEFPDRFTASFATELFTKACSLDYHPTADDLEPLMAQPALVGLIMQYREGLGNPEQAVWRHLVFGSQTWLQHHINSLGFKP